MPQVVISVLLMWFLVWSYVALTKQFTPKTVGADIPQQPSIKKLELLSFRRLGITILLFLGCYSFVSFAVRAQVEHEIRVQQEKTIALQKAFEKMHNMHSEMKPFAPAQDTHNAPHFVPVANIETKFTDIAGMTEAKEEVHDVVNFLRDPAKFTRLGAKSPKGAILYGEPGTGKTLLARAIAGEAGVPFFSVAGSEFDQEWVGVGAARVRQLFESARASAPCIIFIDEIDSLAKIRAAQDISGNQQTVNQLLTEMDGLDDAKNKGIVIIGATNRLDIIDPAVLRPGRLDRHIKIDVPTFKERIEMFQLYLNKITAHPKVQAEALAKLTTGFSGADIANLVNEAAVTATKQNKDYVEIKDFETAKERIVLGSTRSALKVTDAERKITAYHEAGHALVGILSGDNKHPIYKVTITPRGPSLGHTSFESTDEEISSSLAQLDATIAMQLGGRVAEELIFGEQNVTTGAESDLQQATRLAHKMVTKWGYSKRVGPIYQGDKLEFIPKDVIEQEVQKIIMRNYAQAKQLLLKNQDKLKKLAEALLERETLDANEIKELLQTK